MTAKVRHNDERLWALAADLCDGAISSEHFAELETLLRDDEDARLFFAAYTDLHGRLLWRFRSGCQGDGQGVESTGLEGQEFEVPGQPLAMPIFSTLHSPLSTNFVGGPVFSYMVATVVLCLMLLGGWAYKINYDRNIFTADSRGSTISGPLDRRQLVFVGRVTGIKDCRWSDPDTATIIGASVALDREYALASGLLEMTYKTGAKVILEGPCTYRVESSAGGYLARGKLTARVDAKGSGFRVRGLEVGNQKPSNPQSLIPNPFVVRTPTAVVTDLGTEFGVEVDENGNTTSHVFRGAVELRAINGKRPGAAPTEGSGTVLLKAGEGARVERRTDSSLTIRRSTMEDSDAISLRPRMRSRIDVFSTGVGLKEGDIDPRWQIVARSDAADFEPRPAAVTSITYGTFRVNDPARSQWISVAGDLPDLPPVSYTFRTTFELNGVSLETVVLQGRFIADNHVDAIRINGRSVPVPDHGYEKPFYAFHPFAIKDGFVEGTNVLEFEVSNTSPDSRPTLVSPMILRVELYGSAFRGRQAAPAASKNELEQKGKSKGGKHTDGT